MVKIEKKLFRDYFLRAWRELAVIFAVIFVDLLSKYLVSSNMVENGPKKEVIAKFLYFDYVKNPAVAFSFDFFGLSEKLGENGMRIFLIVFVSVVVLGFMAFLVAGYKNRFFYRLPLALIIGGAIGNLYDRIFHNAVRDFVRVEYFGKVINGSSYFPIFNLADCGVVVGGILFMVYIIFFFIKDEKRREAEKKARKEALAARMEETQTTQIQGVEENGGRE